MNSSMNFDKKLTESQLLCLGNGVYFDLDTLIAFQLNGDRRRPSFLFDGKTEDETEINGITISVRGL